MHHIVLSTTNTNYKSKVYNVLYYKNTYIVLDSIWKEREKKRSSKIPFFHFTWMEKT